MLLNNLLNAFGEEDNVCVFANTVAYKINGKECYYCLGNHYAINWRNAIELSGCNLKVKSVTFKTDEDGEVTAEVFLENGRDFLAWQLERYANTAATARAMAGLA